MTNRWDYPEITNVISSEIMEMKHIKRFKGNTPVYDEPSLLDSVSLAPINFKLSNDLRKQENMERILKMLQKSNPTAMYKIENNSIKCEGLMEA